MPRGGMSSGWSVPSQPPPAVQLCQPRSSKKQTLKGEELRAIRQMPAGKVSVAGRAGEISDLHIRDGGKEGEKVSHAMLRKAGKVMGGKKSSRVPVCFSVPTGNNLGKNVRLSHFSVPQFPQP